MATPWRHLGDDNHPRANDGNSGTSSTFSGRIIHVAGVDISENVEYAPIRWGFTLP